MINNIININAMYSKQHVVAEPKCESTIAEFGLPVVTITPPIVCKKSYQFLLSGDFNGDGRMDIMCHDSKFGKVWIYYMCERGWYHGIGWKKNLNWCTHGSVYIGDFNGDRRDDMLCHEQATGNVFLSYANSAGQFPKIDWFKKTTFCMGGIFQLFIGDFNGDCKSDMLCHDPVRGGKAIMYATTIGNFDDGIGWQRDNWHWCYQGCKLYVGDFNGEHRDDMLCYDDVKVKGNVFIAYARWDGTFDWTDYYDNVGWCLAKGCQMAVARVSSDPKDDMVCHCKAPATKVISIYYPYTDNAFDPLRQWRRESSWCSKPTETLFIGKRFPDHCANLVCIDKATGKYSIAFS